MSNENKKEVLKNLFTDDNDINAEELFNLLSPFIKINKSSKAVIFLDSPKKQPLKSKILLFFLAKKVLFLLGEIESDRVKPINIIKETGIPKGSVLPTLKTLKESGFITSNNDGYYITSYHISKIKSKKVLNNDEKNS